MLWFYKNLIVVIIVISGISHVSIAAEESSHQCKLRVGWEDWHPYIYLKNENLVGIELELINRISAAAKCELEFIELPWKRALHTLKYNQLDLLYGASYSADRQSYAHFSIPYRYERFVLILKRPPSPGSTSLANWLKVAKEQDNSFSMGFVRGFRYGDEFQKLIDTEITSSQKIYVRFDDRLRKLLLKNRIDGYLIEEIVGKEHVRTSDTPLYLVPLSDAELEPMHFMFSNKVSLEVRERFDRAIRSISPR